MAMTAELTDLVAELVAIESVNPDLVASGSGESAIAQMVAAWLREQGLEVSFVEPVVGRPSVVGIARGSGGGRSLMLNAHLDTVGAGGMSRPFQPLVRDGRVYGRGACDMKASLAAIMVAAREARNLHLAGDVMVTAVAGEEVASQGTVAVLKQHRADAAIVTEPTDLRLCVAHKGFVWYEVEVRGAAAHGSRPDLGVDAIGRMGPILTGVLELDRRIRAGRPHPLLGTGSLHASTIEGGQEMSTYPDRCVARFERRTVPGEDASTVMREIDDLIEAVSEANASVRAAGRVTLDRDPSEVGTHERVSRAVRDAASQVLGKDADVVGVPYWMDMALINGAGIPAVAFGPIGGGEHADVEWVDIASVERCVEVYVDAASRMCRIEKAAERR